MSVLKPESSCCPICGANELTRFNASASDAKGASVSVTECTACSFAWQYPFSRTAQQSAAWYEVAYRDQGSTGSDYFSPSRKRAICELEYSFVRELPASKSRRLLDVGAGSGMFASIAARNGWSVTAVDPSLRLEDVDGDDIRGFKGGLESIPKDERFDVVTLWDVIEHVEDPAKVIADAAGLLEENGWLVIETGNYKSAARVMGGTEHWIYQLDHRWYFSPHSMMSILGRVGFSEFLLCDKALRPGWQGSTSYSGPSKYQLLRSMMSSPRDSLKEVTKYLRLKRATVWQMAGIEIFTLAARKSQAHGEGMHFSVSHSEQH
jgi:SAM-dependent methyltransferase